MNQSFELNRIQNLITDNIPSLSIGLVILVLTILTSLSVNNYFATKEETEKIQAEVIKLTADADAIRFNKNITLDNINDYNQLLTQLIPDTEDFFSIIYALEAISRKTNFIISQYTLNLASSNSEKLSLTVEGDGNRDAFFQFLKEYQFAGGRLVTIENISVNSKNLGRFQVALNFYNVGKNTVSDSGTISKFSTRDIDFLNAVKNKIQIAYVAPDREQEYEKKTNPF